MLLPKMLPSGLGTQQEQGSGGKTPACIVD